MRARRPGQPQELQHPPRQAHHLRNRSPDPDRAAPIGAQRRLEEHTSITQPKLSRVAA